MATALDLDDFSVAVQWRQLALDALAAAGQLPADADVAAGPRLPLLLWAGGVVVGGSAPGDAEWWGPFAGVFLGFEFKSSPVCLCILVCFKLKAPCLCVREGVLVASSGPGLCAYACFSVQVDPSAVCLHASQFHLQVFACESVCVAQFSC